jgi:hypothetical protein
VLHKQTFTAMAGPHGSCVVAGVRAAAIQFEVKSSSEPYSTPPNWWFTDSHSVLIRSIIDQHSMQITGHSFDHFISSNFHASCFVSFIHLAGSRYRDSSSWRPLISASRGRSAHLIPTLQLQIVRPLRRNSG